MILKKIFKFYLVNRGNSTVHKDELDTLLKTEEELLAGKHVRFVEWNEKEIDYLNKYLFLTAKPMIYLLNMSRKDYISKRSKWLMPIKKKVAVYLVYLCKCSKFFLSRP
jgi:obg-like ATPase 1